MDYPEALAYLSSRGRFGIKLGLDRTRALLDALGSPDAGLKGVLVAGTNGKGSTCAHMVASLVAAGYRVGSMPKPHLHSYTERVQVDGWPIGEAEFAGIVSELRPVVEAVAVEHGQATEFEMLTAGAVAYLRNREVDYLVCEVGMGGRLDSTNALDLGVKVVTTIDLDHTRYLGDTIAAIAAEKAGIIRRGDIVVTGKLHADADEVVRARADVMGAAICGVGRELTVTSESLGWGGSRFSVEVPPVVYDGLRTRLLGRHQAANAAVAVAALSAMSQRHGLRFTRGQLRRGLRGTRWPGRLELIEGSPGVLIDGAHNPAAVEVVVDAVKELLAGPGGARRVVVLFGAMADKDWRTMLLMLPEDWPVVFTAVDEKRAMRAEDMLAAADAMGRQQDRAVEGSAVALNAAREAAGADGVVLVLGSLYLAGEVREALRL